MSPRLINASEYVLHSDPIISFKHIFVSDVSGIPLLLVTDESGVSDMALTHETQEKSAHEKSVMAKQNALGKGKAVPAAEEEASFYTMAMSSASNRDEFHAVTDTKSRRRGSQVNIQVIFLQE